MDQKKAEKLMAMKIREEVLYLKQNESMRHLSRSLRFFYDDTLNHVERIENLINKTKNND